MVGRGILLCVSYARPRTLLHANAGIRRPRRRQPGETAAKARAFRFLEVALSPRILVIGGGLAFMGYIALGPRDEAADDHMVHAWFNPATKRWESAAPWNADYRHAVANRQHTRVRRWVKMFGAGSTTN